MKFLIQILFSVAVFSAAECTPVPSSLEKPVEFTVIDSNGAPVQGAYLEASRLGPGKVEGHTDNEGKLVLQLTEGKSLYLYASKEGFYRTGGRLWNGGIHRGADGNLVARVVPDTFVIEMKRVLDPVDMRHHRLRGMVPLSDKPIGYDLGTGDWIAPFGSGSVADMIFQFTDMEVDGDAFAGTMTLSFPNEGDGIQAFKAARPFSMEFGSDLAPPHRAPVVGYEPELLVSTNHRENESYQSYREDQQNYLFRTRTKLDASGRILQACYGYIQGEIHFDPRDQGGIQLEMNYYFNPNPDPESRSLEYSLQIPQQKYQGPE